jgi:hypothetical protein
MARHNVGVFIYKFFSGEKKMDSSSIEFLEKLSHFDVGILTRIMIEALFGEKLKDSNEDYFGKIILDESNPCLEIYVCKLCALFHMSGILPPENFELQVYKRKAGYNPKDIKSKYMMGLVLGDTQVFNYKGEDYIIKAEHFTPIFDITETDYPKIPKDRTTIQLENGKTTVKARNYLSVVIWAEWEEDPRIPKELQESHIQNALKFGLELQKQQESKD